MGNYNPGTQQSSADKYESWGKAPLGMKVVVDWLRDAVPGGAPGRFGKVKQVGGPGAVEGTLVFTGQPAQWRPDAAPRAGAGNPKHHDFVFARPPRPLAQIPVPKDVWTAFEFVHSEAAEQHAQTDSPNAEWGYWRRAFLRGTPVPVFYLLDENGNLRAFGLAMMFRLAYKYSVGDAVRHAQPAARGQLDLAHLIFGGLDDEKTDGQECNALRGRAGFGVFRLQGPARHAPEVKDVVLGAPKASYYPNYVEQDPGREAGAPVRKANSGKFLYTTYMDDGVMVRGWKRYQPKTRPITPPPPATSTGQKAKSRHVGVSFRPLEAGSVFHGTLRVHNLLPEELGALLWVLDFGARTDLLHTLGMGRPLGYGAVSFRVLGGDLQQAVGGGAADGAECVRRFTHWMEDQCARLGVPGGWAGSRQIHELLALARPLENPEEGRHMRLDHPVDRNEFVTAKKQGLRLAPAGEATWRAPSSHLEVPRLLAGSPHPAKSMPGSPSPGSGPSGLVVALVAEIRSLPGFKLPRRLVDIVAQARKLPLADRQEVARAVAEQVERVWKDGRRNPLVIEVRGWLEA